MGDWDIFALRFSFFPLTLAHTLQCMHAYRPILLFFLVSALGSICSSGWDIGFSFAWGYHLRIG